MGNGYARVGDLVFIPPAAMATMLREHNERIDSAIRGAFLDMATAAHGCARTLGNVSAALVDAKRIARAQQRAEIDAVLREDARRFPAFATARKAAVMAACEMWGDAPTVLASVRAMLINGGWLHSYETRRGGRTKPSEDADRYARHTFGTEVQGHYERARGMR